MAINGSETVIEVTDLFKSYGDIKAVNGISFDVKEGEIFGMLGPNGAGKTTTVEIIEGLREPDSGSVTVLGLNALKNVRDVKERIGIQLQQPALFPALNVEEIVNFFRNLYKKSIPSSEVIDMVALEGSRKVLVKNLSGGQQQRLSLALAFVNDPEIMFLDEPTTGLDPQARRTMWEVIENLRMRGKTVFLTTHYMEEAETLCDRIAVMDNGEIIALGRPQQMIQEHFRERAIQFKMTDYPSEETLAGLAGVTSIATEKKGNDNDDEEEIVLYSDNITATIASLMDTAAGMNSDVYDLFVRQASLEDVFLKLTGRRIRD